MDNTQRAGLPKNILFLLLTQLLYLYYNTENKLE